ncbi:hypothetical protein ACGFNU_33370 [Spirillospora sp. NPDC048911]|uniref:hypothetical protein n=1 Tax=Spirillospora sp. NPDC048911 TaxID=3364527 RepID=UPI003719BDDC
MLSKSGRAAVMACAAVGLLTVAPGVAHADANYVQTWIKMDSMGSQLHIRSSYVDERGAVGFRDSYYRAGIGGASVHHTFSEAN